MPTILDTIGAQMCTISYGKEASFAGKLANVTIQVTPMAAGVGPIRLVWAATGDIFSPFTDSTSGDTGAPGIIALPRTDQDGFRHGSVGFKNWYYKAAVTATLADGQQLSRTYQFQTAAPTLDLDLLDEDGVVTALPALAPISYVHYDGTNLTQDGTIVPITGGGGGGAVASVAGRTGAVVLTKTDVNLSNVDNTADTSKPVSTAQATAILAKSLSLPVNVIVPAGNSVRPAVIGARNSVDASTGPVTVSLPTPTVVGQALIIERADTSTVTANLITVTGTVRGAASTISLAAVGAAYEGALYIAESLTSWAIAGSIKPRAVLDAAYDAKGAATTAQAAAVQRANHTGTQTSGTISDFVEAVQDAVGAFFGAGTGASVTYNDAANTITVTATGSTDPEVVRDAIGAALIGVGNITVTVNDAADTITVSTSATANSTDAALRDRSTHTGTQSVSTITGLGTAATQPTTAFDAAGAASTAQAASLQKTSNLSDLASATTARTNLGLGTAATQPTTAFDAAGAAAGISYLNLPAKPGPTSPIGTRRVVRLGVFPSSSVSTSEAAFEAAAGEMATHVLTPYNFVTPLDSTKMLALHARRQTPVIGLMPEGSTDATSQPAYSLANIIAGNFDSFLTTFFTALKNLNFTVFMRFAHEMNGNWYAWSEQANGNSAGQFATMWQHVYNVAQAAGATNVKWIFCPTTEYGVPGQAGGSTLLSGLYPGDAYVDILGMNGYNFGATGAGGWRDPTTVFGSTLTTLVSLNATKPVWICEMGCADDDGGSKATWFGQFFTWLNSSKVSQFIYYNSADTGKNWNVDSTTANAAAFAAGMAYLRENTQAHGYQLVAGTNTTFTTDVLNRTLTIAATGGSGGITAAKAAGLALILGS